MPAKFKEMISKGVEPLLASAKLKQDGKTVRLDAATDFNLAAAVESMLPSVEAARRGSSSAKHEQPEATRPRVS